MTRPKTLPVVLPAQERGAAASSELLRRVRQGNARALGRFFGGLARASLAASVLATGGCSQTTVVLPPDQDMSVDMTPLDMTRPDLGNEPWVPICTAAAGGWRPAAGITPAMPADWVGLLQGGAFDGGGWTIDESGEACVNARDVAACQEELLRLRTETLENAVLVTDAEGARAYLTPSALAAFLGDIDTAEEAVIMAWQAGYTTNLCDEVAHYAYRPAPDGWELRVTDDQFCYFDPTDVYGYDVTVTRDGRVNAAQREVIRRDDTPCAIGRRPEGLLPHALRAPRASLGRELAEMAHLEASAVVAFDILAEELEALGAPLALVREAKRAALDEVRHAREVTDHARRFGAEPAPVEHAPRPLRELAALALDNATEGCVRETFGALMGHRQALQAADPGLARTMKGIAVDETRHAALSWKIHGWAMERLDAATVEDIERAMKREVSSLRASARRAPAADVADALGLPDAEEAVALVDALATSLWA
ncbi:MAG: ferritin-like domain-containing protein [Myxococcota bacterium]